MISRRLGCAVCVLLCICIGLWAYKFHFRLFNLLSFYRNRRIFSFITHRTHVAVHSRFGGIPHELAGKVLVLSPIAVRPDRREELIRSVLDRISQAPSTFRTHNVRVVDYLDFKSGYAFSPHVDIEWNSITNDGYQVWHLVANEHRHNHGNLFLVYNPYVYERYKGTAYYLTMHDHTIHVRKNCRYNVLTHGETLETFDADWFDQHTRVYYVDVRPGETLVFDRNLCHMTDALRATSRYAVNFRVVYGDLDHVDNCGYINSTEVIVPS